ncbi:MAG: leucine-rich repeat domain-containing protein, partial [Actinobacteria bacterium]|nr:leucine-rich repeat domain-containing protein [Actinomycetota bacterium]
MFDKALTTLIQYPAGNSNVSYIIPSSVTSIGKYAFYYTSALVSITIPVSVVSIGDSAFSNATALTAVTIPASVTSIGQHALFNTTALTAITVHPNNSNYTSINGVLFDKLITTLIQHPGGKTASFYILPSSVTSIGDFALSDTATLTSLTIPSGVTYLGDNALPSSLIVLRFLGAAPTLAQGAFAFLGTQTTAYLPTAGVGFNLDETNKWQGLNVAYPQTSNSLSGYGNCSRGSQLTGVFLVNNKVVSDQVECD